MDMTKIREMSYATFGESSLGYNHTMNISMDNCTLTIPEEAETSLPWVLSLGGDIVLGTVLGILCLLTIIGNAMVLHAVRTERALQSVSNMYIVSLAVADLTVGLVVMPISAIYIFTHDWLFGIAVCQLWIGVDYIASTASILNLFILSLDRYWSVTSPLKYLHKRTKRRALIMITTVWMISSLWLIPIVGWHHFDSSGVRTVPEEVCDTEYATNTALKIITGILNYYLPLAVMYALYIRIFHEIRKRSKLEVGQKNHGGKLQKTLTCPTSSSTDEPNTGPVPAKLHNKAKDRNLNSRAYTCSPNSSPSKPLLPKDKPLDKTIHYANSLSQNNGMLSPRLSNVMTDSQYSDFSDSTCRICYSFDEAVLDPDSEMTHKYCHPEENSGQLSPDFHKNCFKSDQSMTTLSKEYMCNIRHRPNDSKCNVDYIPVSDSDHVYTKRNHISLNLPRNHHECDSIYVFPKENHPAKNHIIGKRCARPISVPSSPQRPRIPIITTLPERRHSTFTDIAEPEETTIQPVRIKIDRANSDIIGQPVAISVPNTSPTSSLLRRIRHTLRHRHRRINSSLQKEIKAARQLGVIMMAFTVCFLPYFVCFMVVAFCEECISINLTLTVTWIGYINSTLNPVLYPLCNAAFRRKFKRMLCIGPKDKRHLYYTGAIHRTSAVKRTYANNE